MEQIIIKLIKQNFNLDDFYTINFRSKDADCEFILLQGENTTEKFMKYVNLGFVFQPYNDTMYKAVKNGISIILT